MKPALALSYSSNGALRGGVAVGWSLQLPLIERDPDYPGEPRYQSSLRGRRDRLVVVDATKPDGSVVHRGEVDDSFTNYVFSRAIDTSYWSALSPTCVMREFHEQGEGRWYLNDPARGRRSSVPRRQAVGRPGDE